MQCGFIHDYLVYYKHCFFGLRNSSLLWLRCYVIGISFNDDFARGVICVGIPYPNRNDRTIKAKMDYNDGQRKFSERKVLHGNGWYKQQAYRAIAQAIGR